VKTQVSSSKSAVSDRSTQSTAVAIFERASGVLLVGAALICFAGHLVSIFESSDTAWLVKTGQLILSTGAIPQTDPFSWTKSGAPWVLYQWLFEATAGLIYQYGGLWWTGLAGALCAGLVLFLLLPGFMFNARVKTPYVFGLLTLAMSNVWFWMRPQLASFLLIPVFMLMLERFRTKGFYNALWLLPPLMVLWANCHTFWFIGLMLIGLYLVPSVFTRKLNGSDRRKVALLCALSFPAVLANPYGFGLVAYTASFLQGPAFSSLYELRPLIVTNPFGNLNAITYFLIASVALFASRKHIPMQGKILSVVSISAAVAFFRYIPVAILLTWPFVAIALSKFDLTRDQSRKCPDQTFFSLGLAATAFVLVPFLYVAQFPPSEPIWFTHSHSNKPVIQFLAKNPQLRARLFTDASIGCSQIMAKQTPVFIDSRFDFYGKEFFDSWLDCLKARGNWQEYLRQWKIETVAISTSYELYGALKSSGDWSIAFDDGMNCVFTRRRDTSLRSIDATR
jgi:hypothetical protein